jgi:nitrogen PTS system EIIA component
MYVNDLLDRRAIKGHANVNSKRQAFQLLSDMAFETLGIEACVVLNALLEREKLGSTGIGQGVGVPHAVLPGLERMRGLFLRLETPIEYQAVDDRPVDLLFALLAPEDSGTEHLRALAKVSRLLRQKDMRDQLRLVDKTDVLFAMLTQINIDAA